MRHVHTRLKILQGTAKPGDEISEINFTQCTPDDFPDPPAYLNADGVALWQHLGKELTASGILCVVDLYALTVLCYQWQRHVKNMKADLEMTASQEGSLRAMMAEFALTPHVRNKVFNGKSVLGPASDTANRFNRFKKT